MTQHDELDADGNIVQSLNKPEALSDTVFIALNTMACMSNNAALYDTTNDPGDQLEWLEDTLRRARQAGKTALIAGNMHPGSAKCNRQWSQRYSALIDAF